MTDAKKKLNYCQFEVMRSGRYTFTIVENVVRDPEAPSAVVSRNEILFPQEGEDANLWHVRDGQTAPLARRTNNRIVSGIGVTVDRALGVRITRWDGFLQAGDGIVILPVGVRCESGPPADPNKSIRPTIYVADTAPQSEAAEKLPTTSSGA